MTALPYAIDTWTAIRDYAATLLLAGTFVVLFYFYYARKKAKAEAKGAARPKSYLASFLFSLMAMFTIGVATECFYLRIYKYGFEYYFPDSYFPLIVFLAVLAPVAAIALRSDKANFFKAIATTIFSVSILVFGVHQLHREAYPLTNKATVKHFMTIVLDYIPLGKMHKVTLERDPDALAEIQNSAIAEIYENQTTVPKYGLNGPNFRKFMVLSLNTIPKYTLNYLQHAKDDDIIAAFKPFAALLTYSNKTGSCSLNFPKYAKSITGDAEAEKIRSEYLDAVSIAVANSNLAQQVNFPAEQRLNELYAKVSPPELSIKPEDYKKLSAAQHCSRGVIATSSLLNLPPSELAEVARYLLTNPN